MQMDPKWESAQRWEPNEAKLKELMVYVAQRSQLDPYFGRTKLNKILFHAEFRCFQRLGKPITGSVYRRLQRGPALRRMLPVLRELEAERSVVENELELGDLTQKRLLPLRKADLQNFTADEIAIVDEVLDELRGVTATQASDASHAHRGWMLVADGEDIPYFAALLADGPPELTEEEIEFARQQFPGQA